MRARADFAEPDLVTLDEELNAKQALASQVVSHRFGDVAAFLQAGRAHGLRLPALDIVAAHLHMANRFAKLRLDLPAGAHGAHRQQRDLVVKVNEALNNDAAVADAPAGHGVVPSSAHIGRPGDLALALARGAHHRLDDAGVADLCVDGGLQLGQRIAKYIGAGRQAQRLGGQTPDAFAVHGQARRAGGGNHAHHTGGFQFFEHGRGNRLDLGHHQVRPLFFNQGLELCRIAHGDGARMVGHLLAGRVLVTVNRNGLHTETLQRNQHFFAQLTRAQQHDLGGLGGQGGA